MYMVNNRYFIIITIIVIIIISAPVHERTAGDQKIEPKATHNVVNHWETWEGREEYRQIEV